ncbi:uncharacterized protein IL334_006755 [Kwoniella shivajii]|uniref:Uncharacterized protein n=1 Tax=Kwoniella shivajii TaxID=564305 RepID=A0ABZ1D8I5_9TREE|nr:hypothetical protein IL334_006755 [Kwoniella shivajii]
MSDAAPLPDYAQSAANSGTQLLSGQASSTAPPPTYEEVTRGNLRHVRATGRSPLFDVDVRNYFELLQDRSQRPVPSPVTDITDAQSNLDSQGNTLSLQIAFRGGPTDRARNRNHIKSLSELTEYPNGPYSYRKRLQFGRYEPKRGSNVSKGVLTSGIKTDISEPLITLAGTASNHRSSHNVDLHRARQFELRDLIHRDYDDKVIKKDIFSMINSLELEIKPTAWIDQSSEGLYEPPIVDADAGDVTLGGMHLFQSSIDQTIWSCAGHSCPRHVCQISVKSIELKDRYNHSVKKWLSEHTLEEAFKGTRYVETDCTFGLKMRYDCRSQGH